MYICVHVWELLYSQFVLCSILCGFSLYHSNVQAPETHKVSSWPQITCLSASLPLPVFLSLILLHSVSSLSPARHIGQSWYISQLEGRESERRGRGCVQSDSTPSCLITGTLKRKQQRCTAVNQEPCNRLCKSVWFGEGGGSGRTCLDLFVIRYAFPLSSTHTCTCILTSVFSLPSFPSFLR